MCLIKHIILSLLLLIFICFNSCLAASFNNEQPIIHVGYTHTEPFFTKNSETGLFNGFTFEYLESISNTLNVDFDYHECKGEQCIRGLLDGKLDMVTFEASPSYKFTQLPFVISKLPMASIAMYLAISDKLSLKNATKEHPFIIGYKRRSTTENDILSAFENYGYDFNGQFIFKVYESNENIFDDFYSVKLDGLVESELKIAEHSKIVLRLGNDSIKLVFNKNNAKYLPRIDDAILKLNNISSSFALNIFLKYVPKARNLVLTTEEKTVLKEHPQLLASAFDRRPL